MCSVFPSDTNSKHIRSTRFYYFKMQKKARVTCDLTNARVSYTLLGFLLRYASRENLLRATLFMLLLSLFYYTCFVF